VFRWITVAGVASQRDLHMIMTSGLRVGRTCVTARAGPALP